MLDIKQAGGIHCFCFLCLCWRCKKGFDYWEEMGGEEDLWLRTGFHKITCASYFQHIINLFKDRMEVIWAPMAGAYQTKTITCVLIQCLTSGDLYFGVGLGDTSTF